MCFVVGVDATIRSSKTPDFPKGINVIQNIDVGVESAGKSIVAALGCNKLDLVFFNAGHCKMDYTFASLSSPSKYILITSEGGSISLRTREEGGGSYGHCASKAAASMVGKILANDLSDKGVTVAMMHPGFMKTDMTRSVGLDQFYESGGAIETSEAAASTVAFVLNKLTHEQTGTFWAPRGPSGIGEAERVMGKDLPTPLQPPW